MVTAEVAEHPALGPCCPSVGDAFQEVSDLANTFPHRRGTGGSACGFELSAWNGQTVFCPWRRLWDHILDRHIDAQWAVLLHTLRRPCVAIEQEPDGTRARVALYRLHPDANPFFFVVLERLDPERLLLVTAFPRDRFADRHHPRIPEHVIDRCAGYCLRRGDQNPSLDLRPRWSSASRHLPTGCCEADLGSCYPDRRLLGSSR